MIAAMHLVAKIGDQRLLQNLIERGFFDLDFKNEKNLETPLVRELIYKLS